MNNVINEIRKIDDVIFESDMRVKYAFSMNCAKQKVCEIFNGSDNVEFTMEYRNEEISNDVDVFMESFNMTSDDSPEFIMEASTESPKHDKQKPITSKYKTTAAQNFEKLIKGEFKNEDRNKCIRLLTFYSNSPLNTFDYETKNIIRNSDKAHNTGTVLKLARIFLSTYYYSQLAKETDTTMSSDDRSNCKNNVDVLGAKYPVINKMKIERDNSIKSLDINTYPTIKTILNSLKYYYSKDMLISELIEECRKTNNTTFIQIFCDSVGQDSDNPSTGDKYSIVPRRSISEHPHSYMACLGIRMYAIPEVISAISSLSNTDKMTEKLNYTKLFSQGPWRSVLKPYLAAQISHYILTKKPPKDEINELEDLIKTRLEETIYDEKKIESLSLKFRKYGFDDIINKTFDPEKDVRDGVFGNSPFKCGFHVKKYTAIPGVSGFYIENPYYDKNQAIIKTLDHDICASSNKMAVGFCTFIRSMVPKEPPENK